MRKTIKTLPSYEGKEPYIYFAFAGGDEKKAVKILRILLNRGCRVWFCTGPSGNSDVMLRRQMRAGQAALTLVYLSDAACLDSDLKNNILVNQSSGKNLLCLDPDTEDRRLKMGLYENVPHIPLYSLRGKDEIESAIVHSDGFSQAMIGEPVKQTGNIIGKLSLLFCGLALILATIFFTIYFTMSKTGPNLRDEVEIQDPVLLSALRAAAGNGTVTDALLNQITFLKLDDMPENWDELSLMPSLERISIPQQALLEGGPLPEGNYTIELSRDGP